MNVTDVTTDPLLGSVVAAILFGVFVVIAITLRIVFRIILAKAKTRLEGGDAPMLIPAVEAVRGPLTLLLLSIGLLFGYLTLTKIESEVFSSIAGTDDIAITVWRVLTILLVTLTLARLSDRLIDWYLQNIAQKTETKIDDTLLPSVRRVLPVALYSIGVLVAIDSVGISISPILAGLGIGGLAVALAVQPTLSNFFAGTYVVTEGELKPGDFIELDGGPSGFVESVGWRSTKIRSRLNNLVIIPNSKMSESIVTNYYSPTPAMNVIVTCGVSYESDLGKVEELALQEANQLVEESEAAVVDADFEPVVRFTNFGDSNIDFIVFMQAIDRPGSILLKSELIMRIHDRFNKEGIEINYPVRKLVIPSNGESVGQLDESMQRDKEVN